MCLFISDITFVISVDQQKVALGLEQRVFFARGAIDSESITVTRTFDKNVQQCITETALVKVRERKGGPRADSVL